jgi:hypothetical protein
MLAVTAAVAAPLAGCGGGGSSKASPTSYVKSVCTAVGSWVTTIKGRASQLTTIKPASAAQGRQELQSFISGVISDTDKALAAIKSAGVPNVSNGQQVATALQGAFTQIKGVLAQSQNQANALPTGSPSAFKTAATKLGTSVQQSLSGIAAGLSALRTPDLQKAASQTSACQSLASA